MRAPRPAAPWRPASYEVDQAADWLAGGAPHALRVLGLLRLALQLTVPGMTLAGGADAKTVTEKLNAMRELLSQLPAHLRDPLPGPGLASRTEPAVGAALRALRALLDTVDQNRRYGGLQVVRTHADDVIWVCPTHRWLYP